MHDSASSLLTAADTAIRRRLTDTTSAAAGAWPGYPHYADTSTGRWVYSPDGDWTGGHWLGLLWLAARQDPSLIDAALPWMEHLKARVHDDTIFRGFLFHYGAALIPRLGLTGPIAEQASELAVVGARGLRADYNPSAGLIGLGTAAEEARDVGRNQTSIDCVGALSALMCWATQQTGDQEFADIGRSHLKRHVEYCLREDGSVCQSAEFDVRTGDLVRRYSHKGLRSDSTWARAQAWGMLAMTQGAAAFGAEYLEHARRLCDWWIAHVPADGIVRWDFDADPITAEQDTSATAIAAAAMLKLAAQLDSDPAASRRYAEQAKRTVTALVSGHVSGVNSADTRPPGMLTHGCYNKHLDLATNSELVWGDYYLYESIHVLDRQLDSRTV